MHYFGFDFGKRLLLIHWARAPFKKGHKYTFMNAQIIFDCIHQQTQFLLRVKADNMATT